MPIVLALPDLAVVVAWVLAMAIILGFVLLQKLISWFMPNWHIPGLGSIRDWVNHAAESVFHATTGWVDAAVGDAWRLFSYPVVAARAFVSVTRAIGSRIYWTFVALHEIVLPALLKDAVETARSLVHAAQVADAAAVAAAESLARSLAAQVLADAETLVGQAEKLATQGISDAVNLARQLAADAVQTARYLTAQAEALAAAGVAEAESLARALEANALAYTDALGARIAAVERQMVADLTRYADQAAHLAADAAVAGLGAGVVTDVGALWRTVTTDVDSAIDAAAGDFADVASALRSIPRDIAADVPASIAAVGALSVPLLRLARDCVIPNCRNLSGLGKLLEDLFSAATDAALVAMLADLVADPEGAATTIRTTLGPLADDTIGLAKTLVGV